MFHSYGLKISCFIGYFSLLQFTGLHCWELESIPGTELKIEAQKSIPGAHEYYLMCLTMLPLINLQYLGIDFCARWSIRNFWKSIYIADVQFQVPENRFSTLWPKTNSRLSRIENQFSVIEDQFTVAEPYFQA